MATHGMLVDVIELSVVVRDLEAACAKFEKLFGLAVHKRSESKDFGFKNAILPTGIGHIEFLEPTDKGKAVGKFLERKGEGVYLVGFECDDVPKAVAHLRASGIRVDQRDDRIAWVHPGDTNGLFVELRKRETYD